MSNLYSPNTDHLTDSAQFLLQSVLESGPYSEESPPNTFWWIKVLLEKRGPMAEDLIPGIDAEALVETMGKHLDESNDTVTLTTKILVEEAVALAVARGNKKANDRDVISAVLAYLDKDHTPTEDPSPEETDTEESAHTHFIPKIMDPTPTLDELGEDLTVLASHGKLGKVLGREEEIRQVMETLCREKKRNPALVGPAGVGKTAIIEGLAQLIVANEVPEPLKCCRLISLQATALVAGAGVVGELEKRLSAVLKEAAQDGILLFIDEVHTIMGAGGAQGKGDVASLLKPALARGEIACIVATTDVEYRKHITADSALERRFNPVLINEISAQHTLVILQSFRDSLLEKRGVNVDDDTLESLVDMAGRFMRNRRFPDKALDLLDHCIAAAITQEKDTVTTQDARVIVQKKVGMPVDTVAGLDDLKKRLKKTNLLQKSDADDFIFRLQSTTEDLDLAPKSPNAVLLLQGQAATIAEDLSASVAEAVFGSANRVVRVDFSGLSQDNHINALVGSPAGYIGHGDPLPHDPLQQTPWCVVWWDNIHLCHSSIRALLARTLQTGVLKDNRGQKAYFSDVVIIATAGSAGGASGSSTGAIGFCAAETESETQAKDPGFLQKTLGKDFLDQCDLVITEAGAKSSAGKLWIKENLLSVTGDRYASRGLEIQWDKTFVEWLNNHTDKPANLKEWEGLLDENLNPALREILRKNKSDRPKKVLVRSLKGNVVVEPKAGD